MRKIQWLTLAIFLLFCKTSFSQKGRTTKSTTPKRDVAFLPMKPQSGQITFSQDNKTIFYFNPSEQKGKVNVLGNDYELNEYFIDSKTKTYTILGKQIKTGEPVSISVPGCHFQKPKGEDCFYGSCVEASVSIPDFTAYLKDISIQDCSSN